MFAYVCSMLLDGVQSIKRLLLFYHARSLFGNIQPYRNSLFYIQELLASQTCPRSQLQSASCCTPQIHQTPKCVGITCINQCCDTDIKEIKLSIPAVQSNPICLHLLWCSGRASVLSHCGLTSTKKVTLAVLMLTIYWQNHRTERNSNIMINLAPYLFGSGKSLIEGGLCCGLSPWASPKICLDILQKPADFIFFLAGSWSAVR